MRNAYNTLARKPEEKRPHGRHMYKLESTIKMYLKEITYEKADWIQQAQVWLMWHAYVNTVTNLQVLYNVGEFLDQLSKDFLW
jgi:hypothetical protein